MKRPRWVWVISLYYAAMFVLSYVFLYLVVTRSIPVPSDVRALTEIEWLVLVVQSFIALSGAIALFCLRKQAYYLFTTGFVIGLGWILWRSLSVMAAAGMLILAAVCLYTRSLHKQGQLT